MSEEDEDLCICAFDRVTEDAWPCHKRAHWNNVTCQACDVEHNTCDYKSKGKGRKREKHECLCAIDNRFCLKHGRLDLILNLWDILGATAYLQANSDEIEALGFAVSSQQMKWR